MLDNLAVEKHYRLNGIGDALLRSLYKELRKRKVWYVQILEEEFTRRGHEASGRRRATRRQRLSFGRRRQ